MRTASIRIVATASIKHISTACEKTAATRSATKRGSSNTQRGMSGWILSWAATSSSTALTFPAQDLTACTLLHWVRKTSAMTAVFRLYSLRSTRKYFGHT